ncbi:hypothetical protein ACN469_22965 [Corallococcus terminator]
MAITSSFTSSVQKTLARTESKLEKLEGKLERALVKEHQLLKDLRHVMQHHAQHGGRPASDGFDMGPRGGCFPTKPLPNEWAPLDLGALRETNNLDQTKGPVTADQLTQAIERGTADLDGNAAGGEYRAFSEWAAKNQDRLTPEAKQVMDLYSKFAANGQNGGIAHGDWKQMLKEMKGVGDKGAEKALAGLDKLPKPISGEDLAKAIRSGTKDADNNTAAELKTFQDWAKKNADKLSPEAKEVMGKFEKHATKAMATGDKDLSSTEWSKMMKDFKSVGDVSARNSLAKLDKENGPISGEDLLGAIKQGAGDADGNSKAELAEFQKWAAKNKDRLTPEAQKVMETYEKHAKTAGPKGLNKQGFDAMVKDASQHKTFHDASMRNALETLDGKNGKISAKDLTNAINKGAGDLDGQAAGLEFADLQKWARQNYDRLSPDARKVVDTYEKYATQSLAKGQTGIANSDFKKMVKEMEQLSAVRLPPRFIAA